MPACRAKSGCRVKPIDDGLKADRRAEQDGQPRRDDRGPPSCCCPYTHSSSPVEQSMSRSGQSIIIRATERQLEHEQDDRARYTGRLSAQWNIGSVPNGGYTLATALNCAQDFVKRRRGKENANLFLASASFHAKVSSETDYVVEVRMLKQGRATTNMEADLLQKVCLCAIACHCVVWHAADRMYCLIWLSLEDRAPCSSAFA